MTLQALIFDVDGTLADTERDGHRPAFNAAFAQHQLDWQWSVECYADLLSVTGGKERIQYYLRKYRPDAPLPQDLSAFIAQLHKDKTRHYTDLLATGKIPLRPGVERLLREAKAAGLRLAIATTTTVDNVTALLRHSLCEESISWFEVIAAGDVVPAKKPAPDIYLYALDKLGLSAQACLAFEDSENGIRSACGAGLRTIITINDYTRTHDFSDALLVLNHLGEAAQACEVLRGDLHGKSYVDVAFLNYAFAISSANLSTA